MSVDRFALDTNVLVYVVDDGAKDKQERARDVFTRAAANPDCVLAMQCVGEFYAAATRRRLVAPDAAAHRARDLMRLFPTVDPVAADAEAALDAATAGRFSYMQDGAGLAGVTVLNPFVGETLPERIATLLG